MPWEQRCPSLSLGVPQHHAVSTGSVGCPGCAARLAQGWDSGECFPRDLTGERDCKEQPALLVAGGDLWQGLKERGTVREGQGPQSLPAQGGERVLLCVHVVLFLMVTVATPVIYVPPREVQTHRGAWE